MVAGLGFRIVGDDIRSNFTAYAVQDSDSLNDSFGSSHEFLAVECALSRRSTAILGVTNLSPRRAGNGHLGATSRRAIRRSDNRSGY